MQTIEIISINIIEFIDDMVSSIGVPTLDQLKVFVTVVETGSFSAAARRLNRRQSVISYTIANLENQLGGLALFDRSKRRPTLTESGRAVLANARTITLNVDELRARVRGLQDGIEPELSIVVDVMMPTAHLVAVLADFSAAFPTVSLSLYVETLGGVPALLLDGTCTIGISGPLFYSLDGLERIRIGHTRLLPVAAPAHALAQHRGPISTAVARKYTQLVLTDRSQLSRGQNFAVLGSDTWRIADLSAKYALLRAGVGWGNMPEPMVRSDLAEGTLVQLPLAEGHEHLYPFHVLHRVEAHPGPAARWLVERFAQQDSQT